MKDVELSSVLVAVNVRLEAFSAIVVADRLMSVGAALLAAEVAAVDTADASVSVMLAEPEPADAASAVAAAFACVLRSSLVAKTPLVALDVRSVSVMASIASLTSFTESIVVSRIVLNAVASIPLALARLVLIWVSTEARSLAFVKSKVDPAAAFV